MTGNWTRIPAGYDEGIDPRATIGAIGLAADRVGLWDLAQFLAPATGVGVFSTRLPMAEKVSPEALRAMRGHLADAAATLLPGSRLDVLAFSCTSGTVAIGPEEVARCLGAVRPGVPVCTPMQAAVKALRRFDVRRIGFLAPYPPETCDLVAGFLEQAGLRLDSRVTFDLELDSDMNRIGLDALREGARRAMTPDSEALFISCTALRTSAAVQALEQEIGKPVFTSNQVLAWDCLRTSGLTDQWNGAGRLFAQF